MRFNQARLRVFHLPSYNGSYKMTYNYVLPHYFYVYYVKAKKINAIIK